MYWNNFARKNTLEGYPVDRYDFVCRRCGKRVIRTHKPIAKLCVTCFDGEMKHIGKKLTVDGCTGRV